MSQPNPEPSAETPTPETDEFAATPLGENPLGEWWEFARTLERRLAAAQAEVEEYKTLMLWLMESSDFHNSKREGNNANRVKLFVTSLRAANATLTAELAKVREDKTALQGRAQLLQKHNEHWVEKLREQEPTMTLYRSEATRLRELVNSAPHTNICIINGPPCTCWKADAARAKGAE